MLRTSQTCIYFLIFLAIPLNAAEAEQQQWIDDNCVVFLTMTIDPKGTVFTARNNVEDRINDYRKSLSRWAQLPYKVVAVESSGYGNPFEDILKNAKNITYVSKNIPHIPARGKGYGEAQIIKYAMDNLIKNNNVFIIKMTGRYAPEGDLSAITNLLQKDNPNAVVKYGRSEWFVAHRAFFQQLANNCIATCDDAQGASKFFEAHLQALSDAKDVIKYNEKIKVLPTRTGSYNVFIQDI